MRALKVALNGSPSYCKRDLVWVRGVRVPVDRSLNMTNRQLAASKRLERQLSACTKMRFIASRLAYWRDKQHNKKGDLCAGVANNLRPRQNRLSSTLPSFSSSPAPFLVIAALCSNSLPFLSFF